MAVAIEVLEGAGELRGGVSELLEVRLAGGEVLGSRNLVIEDDVAHRDEDVAEAVGGQLELVEQPLAAGRGDRRTRRHPAELVGDVPELIRG